MTSTSGCIETVRDNDLVYVLDHKKTPSELVLILSITEYTKRLNNVIATGDSRLLFSNEEQTRVFSSEELHAHSVYARAGLLAMDRELEPVVAYDDQRTIPRHKLPVSI